MKNIKIKMAVLSIGIILGAITTANATPPIQPSMAEGVSTTISKDEIEDILIWAKNSVTTLDKALENYGYIDFQKRKLYLRTKIEDVLKESGKAENELLMRMTLNRVLMLDSLLDQTPSSTNKEYLLGMSLLDDGISLAKTFYQSDLDYLTNIKNGKKQTMDFSASSFRILDSLTRYATLLSQDKRIEFKKNIVAWYGVDLSKTPELRREKAALIKDIYELTTNKDNAFFNPENFETLLNNTILKTNNAFNMDVSLEPFSPINEGLTPTNGVYFSYDAESCGLEIQNISDRTFKVSISNAKNPKSDSKGWNCKDAAKKFGTQIYSFDGEEKPYKQINGNFAFISTITKARSNCVNITDDNNREISYCLK